MYQMIRLVLNLHLINHHMFLEHLNYVLLDKNIRIVTVKKVKKVLEEKNETLSRNHRKCS